MAKKKKPQILYFNKETFEVTIETPERWDQVESFMPSREWQAGERGWVVFGEYGTYDTNGPSGYDSVDVIDLYSKEEYARTTAQAIIAFRKANGELRWIYNDAKKQAFVKAKELKKNILNAEGQQVLGLHWLDSWGYSPKQVQVREVVVASKEKPNNVYSF